MGGYLSTFSSRTIHDDGNLDEKINKNNDEKTMTDHGYWMSLDRNFTIIPPELSCFYCCKEGKNHPLEYFTCYPCCGHKLCLDCMKKNSNYCGECLTSIPTDENAILWIQERMNRKNSLYAVNDTSLQYNLVGRAYINGCHTTLDEILSQPLYERQIPPSLMLAIMNPPNVQIGVNNLIRSAEGSKITAMLDLADTYATNFHNDTFQKDTKKAEFWFQRALGCGNKIFPLAFTRYGEFLMWESRFLEAKNMFEVAATFGHAKGQYYFAKSLLEGEKHLQTETGHIHSYSTNYHDDTTKAIEWLCKASQKGFYIPSYILLATTLIEVAEKAYGDARINGKSPLPRALQMLSLIKEEGYGYSPDVEKQAQELMDRYNNCQIECCNCGARGTEMLPLMTCPGCGVFAYCSNICRKRYFRDGHKWDCCSRDRLFDFHQIKCLLLPWIKDNAPRKEETFSMLPPLSHRRTLMEMVEDDTDAIYGDEELEYDEHITMLLMLRMRKNLETYLDRNISVEKESLDKCINSENRRNLALSKQIDLFSKVDPSLVSKAFVDAMHKIRDYGNRAAHYSPNDPKLENKECEEAVRVFLMHKEEYERKKSIKVHKSESSSQQDNKIIFATTQIKKDLAQEPKKKSKKRSKKKSSKKNK